MNAAYTSYFGTPMVATDTYRSLSGQIQCTAEKGDMCAVPGTSNHGWGLAIDFGGGINNFGTAQHIWMTDNSEKYGWYHPSWAQQDGSKPEPWHWEYIATK
jgi:LAS superfamily LD-carboxypeptidase LdcB